MADPPPPTKGAHGRTYLVRCLLDEWTSISLLLNSFSSFRIAAYQQKQHEVWAQVKPPTPQYIDDRVVNLKPGRCGKAETSVV